jgi:FAD/FMN-containing dehydrogenase
VAGYELGKLFCGSRGQLGLVARASLRLHPRPDAVRTLAVPVESPEEAERGVQALLGSQLVPSAVDLLWPGWLVMLFEGARPAVDFQFAAARELVGGTEDFGSIWEEIGARQQWAQGRVAFLPGRLAEVLAGLSDAVVRVAAGVAYVAQPVPDRRDEGAVRLVDRIRAEFDPRGVLV